MIAIVVVYLLVVLTIGVYCADYFIWAITGQDLPLIADAVVALFFGSITIPGSILLWVLGLLGIMYPLMAQ